MKTPHSIISYQALSQRISLMAPFPSQRVLLVSISLAMPLQQAWKQNQKSLKSVKNGARIIQLFMHHLFQNCCKFSYYRHQRCFKCSARYCGFWMNIGHTPRGLQSLLSSLRLLPYFKEHVHRKCSVRTYVRTLAHLSALLGSTLLKLLFHTTLVESFCYLLFSTFLSSSSLSSVTILISPLPTFSLP